MSMTFVPGLPGPPSSMNDEQTAAIAFEDSTWVSAGAGSGKTRTLVELYLKLMDERDIGPERLVAITFTEKAAGEMKDRIRQAIDERILQAESAAASDRWIRRRRDLSRAPINTIHGFCSSLLRENPVAAGVDPSFEVIQDREAKKLLDRVLEDVVVGGVQNGDRATADLVAAYTLVGYPEFGNGGVLTIVRETYQAIVAAGMTVAECRRLVPQGGEAVAPLVESIGKQVWQVIRVGLQGPDKLRQDASTFLERWSKLRGAFETITVDLSCIEKLQKWMGPRRSLQQSKATRDLWKQIKEDVAALQAVLAEAASIPFIHRLLDLVERVDARYRLMKERRSAVDFEDLQVKARNLLRDVPPLRERYQQAFDVLMVDEYQDTNPLQDEIVRLLAGDAPRRLFVVGDAKQSIYGFRGADVSVFKGLSKVLPQIHHLRANYRSVPRIVTFVNDLFSQIVMPAVPNLFPQVVMPHNRGADLQVRPLAEEQVFPSFSIRFSDEDAMICERTDEHGTITALRLDVEKDIPIEEARLREAQLLADHIANAVGTLQVADGSVMRPARFGDCAMLFRVTTRIKVYEHELRRRGIPYYVVKGHGFFECQEIKDLSGILSYLDDRRNVIPLAGFLRSPMVGLSDSSLLRLSKAGFFKEDRCAIELPDKDETDALHRALGWLAEWTELRDRLSPSELLERIVRSTGYLAAIVPLFQGAQKVANVRKLIDLAREYEEGGPYNFRGFVRLLTEWIETRAREPEYPVWAEKADVVRIMSVHQAKGLQFPIVYVPQMSRENRSRAASVLFHPQRGVVLKVRPDRYHDWVVPPAMAAVQEEMKAREDEESRRLFYVATTRAADHLVMSGQFDAASAREGTWSSWVREYVGGSALDGDPTSRDVEVIRRKDVPTAAAIAVEMPVQEMPDLNHASFQPPPLDGLSLPVRDIAEYVVCARRHYYSGILNLEETPPRTRVAPIGTLRPEQRGSLVHRVLEMVSFDASSSDVERLMRRLAGGWDDEVEHLCEQVVAFLQGPTGRDLREARQVAREVPLTLTVRDANGFSLLLSGVADIVYEDADGVFHVLGYKLSRLGRGKLPLYHYQLSLYALALMEAYGLPEVKAGLRFVGDSRGLDRDFTIDEAEAASLTQELIDAGRRLSSSSRRLEEEEWPKVADPQRCQDLECGFRWRCGRNPCPSSEI